MLNKSPSNPTLEKHFEIPASVPHNIEAEQALLGALLLSDNVYDKISSIVSVEHFYDPLHGRIFQTIVAQLGEGNRVNPVTLKPFFAHEENIGTTTVAQYLGNLCTYATSVMDAPSYAKTIRELYQLRELALLGEDMAATARYIQTDMKAAEQISEAEMRLFTLAETATVSRELTQFDSVHEALDVILMDPAEKRKLVGRSTGFVALDAKIGGMRAGNLLILAGRPGQGKSALALNIAMNVAANGCPVAFFSLEMTAQELVFRQISQKTGIAVTDLLSGEFDDAVREQMARASLALAKLPITFDETGGISIGTLALRARRLVRTKKIGLLVVDYLQLLKGNSRRNSGNTNDEITEISNGLKALAKELRIPVLALSQLSRQVENREDKRPQLSDLRSSGSIEQDADVAMFVYRDEYYLERSVPPEDPAQKWFDWNKAFQASKGKAEIIVGKNRGGEVGTAHVNFNGRLTLFHEGSSVTPIVIKPHAGRVIDMEKYREYWVAGYSAMRKRSA